MRKCKKCGAVKPDEAFEQLPDRKNLKRGWRRGICKDCIGAYAKTWRQLSKESLQARNRRYYEDNRDHILRKQKEWAAANPERRRGVALEYYYRLQDKVIKAYGGYVCAWCGIDEPTVLCIDHVENNGNQHRKQLGSGKNKSAGGGRFYRWLIENGYPTGYQVLCMNCNHAKARNGGKLPKSLKGRCNDYPKGVRPSGRKRTAPQKLRMKR